jgi:hypothetical protein
MTDVPPRELQRLPQARRYLRSARWGFEDLLAKKIVDTPFIFYLIGILASLRAVQHALMNHDSTLSKEHERLIDEWWENNAKPDKGSELHFIRTSRNRILKGANLAARAIYSESAIGEGSNREITSTSYELFYYDDAGQRQDLEEAVRRAIEWCDRELTALETKLPPRYDPDPD